MKLTTTRIIAGMLVVALVGAMWLAISRWAWPYGMYGMMQGYGMMGRGFSWGMPFWGGVMLLAMAAPALLLAALLAAILLMVGRSSSSTLPAQAVCQACGQPVQPGWRICPHCETRLQQAYAPPEKPAA